MNGDPEEKIVIQDPRNSTPGLGFLLWMKAVYGDRAPEKWRTLSKRILTVTPGWSEAYGLFTSGEAPMVLSYTTSPAYHMIEEKTERYRAAAFAEGHYLQVELAGRLRASKQPELAARFLQFLVSPEAQAILPTTNWAYPAAPSAATRSDTQPFRPQTASSPSAPTRTGKACGKRNRRSTRPRPGKRVRCRASAKGTAPATENNADSAACSSVNRVTPRR